MEAKLDCNVDVEGSADMMKGGEEGASVNRRSLVRPNTTHEPRGNAQWMHGPHVARTTKFFSNQFPVHTFTKVQRQQAGQRSDVVRLTRAHILIFIEHGLHSSIPQCSHQAVTHSCFIFCFGAR